MRGGHQHPVGVAMGQARHRRDFVLFQRVIESSPVSLVISAVEGTA